MHTTLSLALTSNYKAVAKLGKPILTYLLQRDTDFMLCRGFPVEQYRNDRLGLIIAFYGLGLVLGRPQISQTDNTEDSKTFGEHLPCHTSWHSTC